MLLFLLIVLAFFGYHFYNWTEEQARQAAAVRTVKVEEERHDRIVNCPTCEGTGECWFDYRVLDDGSVMTKPERRVDIERLMDDDFKHFVPETHFRVDDYGTSYQYRRGPCPHCVGKGTAHAWFETIPEHDEPCKTCSGGGSVVQTVKVAVGVDRVQATCPACLGRGKTTFGEKRHVHIRFLGGEKDRTIDIASFKPPTFFDVSQPRIGMEGDA